MTNSSQRLAKYILLLFLLSIGACSAATQPTDSSSGYGSGMMGKSDKFNDWSRCEQNEVLFFLNQKSTDAAAIEEAGVHSRGAGNIYEYRKGEDGQDWTKDDRYFSSVQDVDDVHWVGPGALESLKKQVADRCSPLPSKNVETIFSPKAMENSHVARSVELIENADESIDIAMYSFGTQRILDALERADERGVSIRFIFHEADENDGNPETTMSDKLEDAGIDVRYVNKIMHHKYMIIDGPRKKLTKANEATVFTSSGNWSHGAASRYDENTVIVENEAELTLRLQREFNTMWEHSRDFESNDDLAYFESHDIHKDMIPNWPGLDAHFTSTNFDTYVSEQYGNTFSVDTDKRHVSKQIVRLIENATDSIWIASGHMRYRPIANALIEKHEQNPDMDIRVYLDDQEYISKGYYYHLQSELDDCLEAAEDECDKDECKHSGFYFSYPLHEAGIDLRFKYYSYYWHYRYAKQMHHKYLIIDGDTAASGSYNFSQNAEHNTFENLIVYREARYPELIDSFEKNFETIWDTRRGEVGQNYDELLSDIEDADDRVPIRYEPIALTWPEVTQLQKTVEEKCPAVESEEYSENPREHSMCYIDH